MRSALARLRKAIVLKLVATAAWLLVSPATEIGAAGRLVEFSAQRGTSNEALARMWRLQLPGTALACCIFSLVARVPTREVSRSNGLKRGTAETLSKSLLTSMMKWNLRVPQRRWWWVLQPCGARDPFASIGRRPWRASRHSGSPWIASCGIRTAESWRSSTHPRLMERQDESPKTSRSTPQAKSPLRRSFMGSLGDRLRPASESWLMQRGGCYFSYSFWNEYER